MDLKLSFPVKVLLVRKDHFIKLWLGVFNLPVCKFSFKYVGMWQKEKYLMKLHYESLYLCYICLVVNKPKLSKVHTQMPPSLEWQKRKKERKELEGSGCMKLLFLKPEPGYHLSNTTGNLSVLKEECSAPVMVLRLFYWG